MSREAADVCREAAQVIQARGLCKRGYIGANEEVCLWGALWTARGRWATNSFPDLTDAVASTIHEAISARLGDDARYDAEAGWAIQFAWNDAPERTAADVQKLLLQVADDLDVA